MTNHTLTYVEFKREYRHEAVTWWLDYLEISHFDSSTYLVACLEQLEYHTKHLYAQWLYGNLSLR